MRRFILLSEAKFLPLFIVVPVIAQGLVVSPTNDNPLPAFPTAEGYGKYTVGGRGGTVYEVTTLKPYGPGSLGAAIEASGPRIVVFRVSGTIEGDFVIRNDYITIAGQTAPGDGICIKGRLQIKANNVIIRYIRVRSKGVGDAVEARGRKNIILDHVSASWGADEVMSVYRNENVTIQWCIISEACGRGGKHRFGGIWGNNYGTYHHNLFAHNDSRNPRWASGTGFNDFRNNVIYNWGYQSCYGGERGEKGFTVNMVANYYKPGPATRSDVRRRIAQPSGQGSWYVAENVVVGYPEVTDNNWLGVDGSDFIKLVAPWKAMPINQQRAEEAYLAVLERAGCSLPRRDPVDARIVQEVRSGTATYGNNGIIDSPNDVGGWPTLRSEPAPADSDHDGMPNSWEVLHRLNPFDKSDGNKKNLSLEGYTNIEVYLNELAGDPVKCRVCSRVK
ncbi:MAG: pectate lyase [Armatimonadetes bacterium]|nr:pectate lyase [Armatimonadota bacterium]MCX7969618.1 pectate lyase [Armatimonadota bacterium]MDW8144135.1 pectate lyase [Armatimonadota bacterium]